MTVETRSRRQVLASSSREATTIKHPTFCKNKEKEERESLVLWNSPVKTLSYFMLECSNKLMLLFANILNYRKMILSMMMFFSCWYLATLIEGPHQESLLYLRKKLLWWLWWIGLGFLSSCGFGTGLHTFVLYLGPFIAEVTLAAHECGTTNFPEPPYPDQIVCPETGYEREALTLFQLIRKTDLEAILWGLGTAVGELPPYFMARSARLSGSVDEEDEELLQFEQMVASVEQKSSDLRKMDLKEKMEYFLHQLIERAGFLGILLCASIPNPLFDLAGMTCGHFLVPFWHFFGATFIGKALVKVHIQQIAIIALSSDYYINWLLDFLGSLPQVGEALKKPILQYIDAQKHKLHSKHVDTSTGWIPWIISGLVLSLMVAFAVSIVHAFAKDYHRRLCKWRHHADGEIKVETINSNSNKDH